jgi:hypothetical protein
MQCLGDALKRASGEPPIDDHARRRDSTLLGGYEAAVAELHGQELSRLPDVDGDAP